MINTLFTRPHLIETVLLSEQKQNLLQYQKENHTLMVWLVQNIAAQMNTMDPVPMEVLLQTWPGVYALTGQ